MYKLLNFLVLLLLPFAVQGQVNVSAELSKTEIIIGDQVNLNLIVSHGPGVEVIGADLSNIDTLQKVEVLEVKDWDTISREEVYVLEQKLVLTSFDSGAYFIPQISINYKDAAGILSKAFTPNEIPLVVNTIPIQGDSTNLAPIKPIIEEALNFRDFLPYIIGVLGVGLVSWLVYYFMNRKKNEEVPALPEVKLPAHEIAFNKLDLLKQAKLWQKGQIKEYQSELTYIVREYLENRFHINALESTTYEVMQQLKKSDMQRTWKEKLRELLQAADLVKFAKAEPPISIHDKAWEDAQTFVQQTKQVIVEPNEETDELEEQIENENS